MCKIVVKKGNDHTKIKYLNIRINPLSVVLLYLMLKYNNFFNESILC